MMTTVNTNNATNVIFQPLFSSGLLTVQLENLTENNTTSDDDDDDHCWYLIYLRGKIIDDQPMKPDEIRFNQSLCLSCSEEKRLTTMIDSVTSEEMTSPSTILDTSTIILTTNEFELISTTSTTEMIPLINQRTGLCEEIILNR